MIAVIPAMDLSEGRCIRLKQGNFAEQTAYEIEPLEFAKKVEAAGIKRLHMVDLDGARQRKLKNLEQLERIANGTGLQIDFGGGVTCEDDLASIFRAGAAYATIGSIALQDGGLFSRWIAGYGPQKIILAADFKNGRVALDAWRRQSTTALVELLLKFRQDGGIFALCTDISRDGLLAGPDSEAYRKLQARVAGLNLIASGGVSCLDDIKRLNDAGLYGVIVGRALYENKIDLEQLREFTC